MFPDFVKGEEAKENGEMDADIPLAPACCLGDLKLPFFFHWKANITKPYNPGVGRK